MDDQEYIRIRQRMRLAVLKVWRDRKDIVIAGMDPWIVVDEAWSSMAAKKFACKGSFAPFACRVARNKAIDAVNRRAAVRYETHSLDAPVLAAGSESFVASSNPSPSAEDMYIQDLETKDREAEELDELEALDRIQNAARELLDVREQLVFYEIQNGKSAAAVGRELEPPLSGQRVGQILKGAIQKIVVAVGDLQLKRLE